MSGQVQYMLSSADSVPNTVDEWFFVNPTTGSISVITNLRDDTSKRTEYIVSHSEPAVYKCFIMGLNPICQTEVVLKT